MSQYENDIAQLERKYVDEPTGQIVFYGSSSIRLWPFLKREFPGVSIENWGFGGSTLAQCAHFFNRAIAARKPRGIVFYAGDNDLANGSSPEQVWQSLSNLLDARDANLPSTPFAFGALKPSPSRLQLKSQIEESNEWCVREIASRANCEWLDWFSPMLDSQTNWGKSELFMTDELHLSRAGYGVWNSVLKRDLDWLQAGD